MERRGFSHRWGCAPKNTLVFLAILGVNVASTAGLPLKLAHRGVEHRVLGPWKVRHVAAAVARERNAKHAGVFRVLDNPAETAATQPKRPASAVTPPAKPG